MKRIWIGYFLSIAGIAAAALTLAVAFDGLNPVIGSKLGTTCLHLAIILFLVGISLPLALKWQLRILFIVLIASGLFTGWWYIVVQTGDYRITVPSSVIFLVELVNNTVITVLCMAVEYFVIGKGRKEMGHG